VPARVAVGLDDRPVRVTTDRRGFAGGGVTACVGPWRTSGEWWEPGAAGKAGAAAGWDRDEWDVALNDGAMYRIFRDRFSDAWFVEAIVD
jgi:protein ImuB